MTLYQAIKSWLKQLNSDGDFIPISTIADEAQFKPMYLVVKSKRRFRGLKTYTYRTTGIKLQKLLLSGDHAAELEESKLFIIGDEVDEKGEGNFAAGSEPGSIQVGTNISMSHARNVRVKKRNISPEYLASVHEDGKVNMDLGFIRQSEKFQRNLHVITDTIETVEKTQCVEASAIKGSFASNFNSVLRSIFQISLEGGKEQKKTIAIPKDCTLAFRVRKLYIQDGELYISAPEDTSDTGTFEAEITVYTKNGKTYKDIAFFPRHGSIRLHFCMIERRTNPLQRDIEKQCAQLFLLSAHLSGQFLTGFVAIMRENDLLQELRLQLERALEGFDQFRLKTDHSELQKLGVNLQDSNGVLITSLAEPVLYFLQALDELTGVQLVLLADSTKKVILSKQLALVKSILDHEENCTAIAQLESPFAEEELNITGVMIESSGVTLQREGPTFVATGDPHAFMALETLYVALYILDKIQRAT